MLKYILFFSFFTFIGIRAFSQEPLPDFSIKKGVQNQKVISWRNNFGDIVTVLNVQRSNDSVRNFRTLYSVPNPTLAINAYTDIHPVPGMDYYRIYYQLKNGSYFFTRAKKIATGFLSDGLLNNLGAGHVIIKGDEERTVTANDFRRIADSVLSNTSDSIFYFSDSTVNYKKYNPMIQTASNEMQSVQQVSDYLYLNADGSVVVHLPQNAAYRFSMTIYRQDGSSVLYKINHFDNAEIILSKSSFMRTGFYPYELFEDGKLKERNKFQIK